MPQSGNMEMQRMVDDVPVNAPVMLEQICINYLVKNCNNVLFKPSSKTIPKKVWVTDYSNLLPPIISDRLFDLLQKHSLLPTDELLDVFSDSSKCLLQKCRIFDADVKISSLENLISNQNIQEVEMKNVELSAASADANSILNLEKLTVFHHVLSPPTDNKDMEFDWGYHLISKTTHPHLRSLKLCGTSLSWYFLFDRESPPLLTHLDLTQKRLAPQRNKNNLNNLFQLAMAHNNSSDPNLKQKGQSMLKMIQLLKNGSEHDVMEINFDAVYNSCFDFKDPIPGDAEHTLLLRYRLTRMKETLISLSLYDSPVKKNDWEEILSLKKLKHLDISLNPRNFASKRPETTVWEIMENFPDLMSLDVSGTETGNRLYNDGIEQIRGDKKLGLVPSRKLDFLGLCSTEGSEITNIYDLATKVTGYANEYQTMFCIEHYMSRPAYLSNSLHEINRIHHSGTITCPQKLIRLVLEILEKYPKNENVVLACSCSLDYLTREHYVTFRVTQRNTILLALIKCLEQHPHRFQIVRNSIISMYHFDAQNDFFVFYERVAKVMLKILKIYHTQADVNLMSVHFCNVIVCSLTRNIRKEVEKVLFVETILPIIQNRIENENSDDILEVCWSIMWNVTDEMPQNSETLINLGGLGLIQKCYEVFPNNIELLKNIMGLVGNIAEVKPLRKFLMTEKLVKLFSNFLLEDYGSIELAYNSCGTLAHMVSDGPEAWTVEDPSRDVIRKQMFDRVESWNIETRRNINYRSFKPILHLIKSDVPECVHWAVWALCNLSMVDSIRYCRLLIDEDGVDILTGVQNRMTLNEKTRKLATIIVRRIKRFENQSQEDYAENDVL